MSTVPVYFSHLTSGLNNSAQTLPRSVQAANSCGGALCSGWRGGVDHGVKVLARDSPLGSEWTGSESRITYSTLPRSSLESKKFLAGFRGPIGGLLHLRPVYKANLFNVAPVHYMFSAPQRRRSFCDTRLAYGYYLGPAYGYGGGFGSGSILVFIVLGFIVVQTFQSLTSGRSEGLLTRGRDKVTVLKLQVGLLGFARTLQNDLERISDQADTSTSRGLHYVLTETVLALLRQPDMCILGTSMAEVKRGVEAGESRFNQLSLEERGKFDEETLVNVDGNRKRGLEKSRGDGFSNEYIVVTLLVAAEGDYSLPAIYDNNDLKEALKTLGSIPADSIQGVEILWTPQDKSDSLTERDLLRNYPLLKSL